MSTLMITHLLYVFSHDGEYKKIVFNNTQGGAAIANEVVLHRAADGLPFGGVGPSGYGFHIGKYSFDMFTHLRASLDSPGWIDKIIGFRFPPYTDSKLRVAGYMAPSLPTRPKGPPSMTGAYSKWWWKWYLLWALG